MRTSQCDRDRIDDFFRKELVDADVELARHLERCAECRLYFDSQAAPPDVWSEAQRLLRPSKFDLAGSAAFSGGGQGCLATQPRPSIQAILDSLVPSEDPDRLGRTAGGGVDRRDLPEGRDQSEQVIIVKPETICSVHRNGIEPW